MIKQLIQLILSKLSAKNPMIFLNLCGEETYYGQIIGICSIKHCKQGILKTIPPGTNIFFECT